MQPDRTDPVDLHLDQSAITTIGAPPGATGVVRRAGPLSLRTHRAIQRRDGCFDRPGRPGQPGRRPCPDRPAVRGERAGQGGLPGGRDDRGSGQHRRHGSAAPRRLARSVRRAAGAVHARVVPAVVHLGQRAAGTESTPGGAGGAGPPRPAAARRGHARLPGHRLAAEAGLRVRQAGRGVRAYEDRGQEPAGAGAERAGRDDQHAAGRPGHRRHAAAGRERRLPPAVPPR